MPFRLGFLILAHDDIHLLNRIIARLSSQNVYFFIHIDNKCNESFNYLENNENTYILRDRLNIEWGDISVVNAILSLSQFALQHPSKCDYFVLLSGHDYPLKNAKYIYNYFNKNKSINYTIGHSLPSKKLNWISHGMLRVKGYSVRLNNRQIATIIPRNLSIINIRQLFKVVYYNRSKIKESIKRLCSFRRVFPNSFIPYGGELWFRVTRESLLKIINYVDTHPEYHKYMAESTIPDEIYFNTLIYNLSTNNINDNLTFINWTGESSPKWIQSMETLSIKIDTSNYLFARKFKNTSILNFIDKKIDA